MKRLLTLSLLLTLVFSFAQEKIKVVYKSQMKVDFDETEVLSDSDINNDEMERAFKEALEEVHYYELTSKGDESSFKRVEKINNDLPNDGGMKISIFASGGLTFKNIQTKEYLEELPSFGKDYIITDTLKNYDWKLTREKSKVLNYDVRKATAIIDSITTVEAWYTTQIPIKSGPEDYWGLPGLILKVVNKYDGKEKREFYYEATEVFVLEDNEPIEKPTKGELITREAFDEEQDKQMQKFREMHSGGVDTVD